MTERKSADITSATSRRLNKSANNAPAQPLGWFIYLLGITDSLVTYQTFAITIDLIMGHKPK